MDAVLVFFSIVGLSLVAGVIGGVLGALMVEAHFNRHGNITGTEFHLDRTEYDVPEWEDGEA